MEIDDIIPDNLKPEVKSAVKHFGVLIDQVLSETIPETTLVHLLRQDFANILKNGTRNDAWELLEAMCKVTDHLTGIARRITYPKCPFIDKLLKYQKLRDEI